MVVQVNDGVTQPSRSRLVHHELLPLVNTEGLLGVPDVAANSNKKHSLRPFSKCGTKVGVTTCTASVPWARLMLFHLFYKLRVQRCIGVYMTAAPLKNVQ